MLDRLDPRSLLERPWLHRTFRGLVTTKAGRAAIVNEYLRPRVNDEVLDIGCGTGDLLEDLPAVRYLGFDISEPYIRYARGRYGARGTFVNTHVSRDAVSGDFDLVIAYGVLHHLPDGEAEDLLGLADSVLKPPGRLVTIDPCFHPGQAVLRRFVISLDRGEHVRTVDGYTTLAQSVFKNVVGHTRNGLVRLPYTHLILECSR